MGKTLSVTSGLSWPERFVPNPFALLKSVPLVVLSLSRVRKWGRGDRAGLLSVLSLMGRLDAFPSWPALEFWLAWSSDDIARFDYRWIGSSSQSIV